MDVERSSWAWSGAGIVGLLVLHFLLRPFLVSLPVAPNLLNENFTVQSPDRICVGDITYIPIGEAVCIWLCSWICLTARWSAGLLLRR